MDRVNRFNPDDVIACRNLCLVGPDGSESEVVVSIGRPQPFEDSKDYWVPYKISGGGIEKEFYAGGIDAIQALQLVMVSLGAELKALSRTLGGRLKWNVDEAFLGFPSPAPGPTWDVYEASFRDKELETTESG
jgi:hypothetical protein